MAFFMGKDPDVKEKSSDTGTLFALGMERGRRDAEKKDEEKKEKRDKKK